MIGLLAEMKKCRWLKPRLVAMIDYLERTAANHLRQPMFAPNRNSSWRGAAAFLCSLVSASSAIRESARRRPIPVPVGSPGGRESISV
jgi:hypothetical protein